MNVKMWTFIAAARDNVFASTNKVCGEQTKRNQFSQFPLHDALHDFYQRDLIANDKFRNIKEKSVSGLCKVKPENDR